MHRTSLPSFYGTAAHLTQSLGMIHHGGLEIMCPDSDILPDNKIGMVNALSNIVFRDIQTTINNEKHIEINICISTTFRF